MGFSCRPPCAARAGVARTHARLTPSTVVRSDVLSSASQLEGRLLPAAPLRLRQPERWRRSARHCPCPNSTACICGRSRNDTARCARASRWSWQSSRTVYISRAPPIRRRAGPSKRAMPRATRSGVPSIDRLPWSAAHLGERARSNDAVSITNLVTVAPLGTRKENAHENVANDAISPNDCAVL
jgi:hypothetical protein